MPLGGWWIRAWRELVSKECFRASLCSQEVLNGVLRAMWAVGLFVATGGGPLSKQTARAVDVDIVFPPFGNQKTTISTAGALDAPPYLFLPFPPMSGAIFVKLLHMSEATL